jgi:hypothetical protein
MKIIQLCSLIALSAALSAHAGSEKFLKKGYIQNDAGEKCTYSQTVNQQEKYFHDALTAITGTIVFDDPQCMKDSGIGLDTNKMMINNIISRWYGQPDAKFKTRASELYAGSMLQTRGRCMQSSTYKALGIAVDYTVKSNSITQVKHSSTVQGCTK